MGDFWATSRPSVIKITATLIIDPIVLLMPLKSRFDLYDDRQWDKRGAFPIMVCFYAASYLRIKLGGNPNC